MANKNFPHDTVNVTAEEDKIIKKYYKDYVRPFVRVGPSGYLATAGYADHAADIYGLDVRPDDLWVVSFSRSGTTWLQELVWLVANDMDFEGAAVSLTKRFAYIEYPTQAAEIPKPTTNSTQRATEDDFRTFPHLPSPRYVKTHLPLSLLPPKLLETSKVFYVAREPRDVAVSFYFMHQLFGYFDEDVTFEEFWELFKSDLVLHLPIFEHIKESWARRSHPNLIFLFYEDMQNDLLGVIEKVCSFLDRDYSAEQKQKLADYLSFDNMKKHSLYKTAKDDDKTEIKFMRKGKSGNWVNYFNDNMKKESEEYMEKHLTDTDLRFPEVYIH